MARLDPEYNRNVFINCPFDPVFAPMFEAIVFCVHVLGFRARESGASTIVGGSSIYRRYLEFRRELSDLSAQTGLDEKQLTFADFTNAISNWLQHRT